MMPIRFLLLIGGFKLALPRLIRILFCADYDVLVQFNAEDESDLSLC
jgi:hypothetical protein